MAMKYSFITDGDQAVQLKTSSSWAAELTNRYRLPHEEARGADQNAFPKAVQEISKRELGVHE